MIQFLKKDIMIYLQENLNFTDCTLIFPSVSVGNVGQLTTDLLITKLKPKKVGLIWHSAIMPMTGGDPYDFNNPNLTTSAEVYFSEQRKIVIIQIRSPITKNLSSNFIQTFVEWIMKNGISKVFILTGVFDYTRHDIEIRARSLKILTSPSLLKECEIFEPKNDTENLDINQVSVATWDGAESKIKLHGGGIAKRLFAKCIAEGIPTAVVMKFCSEGDNVPDSQLMCNCVNRLLKLVPSGSMWETPPSWINMFGNSPQLGLY